ncbi:MAG TPA: hypothetical protein VII94_05585 [Candidatus Saccharimonadales bacterium]
MRQFESAIPDQAVICHHMTLIEKEALIIKMISTPQGKQALAASMVQPLKNRLGFGNDDKKWLRSIHSKALK